MLRKLQRATAAKAMTTTKMMRAQEMCSSAAGVGELTPWILIRLQIKV